MCGEGGVPAWFVPEGQDRASAVAQAQSQCGQPQSDRRQPLLLLHGEQDGTTLLDRNQYGCRIPGGRSQRGTM